MRGNVDFEMPESRRKALKKEDTEFPHGLTIPVDYTA
jgi:hypothetical protein